MDRPVTFVCSRIGGGKTYISQLLAQSSVSLLIEVSDIVKLILGESERTKIINHIELEDQIIEEIYNRIRFSSHSSIVISGARQVGILKSFPKATLIWLEVDRELRFRRYIERATDLDKDTYRSRMFFDISDTSDVSLGLDAVKEYIVKKEN